MDRLITFLKSLNITTKLLKLKIPRFVRYEIILRTDIKPENDVYLNLALLLNDRGLFMNTLRN